MVHAVHVNTHFIGPAVEAILRGLKATGRKINFFLVTMMEANPRMKQIEYMQNLTDVELATKYGINRDGIAAFVFRDKMY